MKECENCGNDHDGSYGSGRFCSTKCARGFSTKAKRKEINEKISNTLKGNILSDEHKQKISNKIRYLNSNNLINHKSWNKGLTKNTNKIVNLITQKNIKRYKKNGHPWKGKHHTKETKEKLSLIASQKNNGFVKTKWYEILCPYENKNVKVQGTWELKYAIYLNDNNILWQRPKNPLKYKLHNNDYNHSYFPDFYLIESNEYVEIKGYWWKSKDDRVDDKRKMEKVIEQNKDKKIIIIEDITNYLG